MSRVCQRGFLVARHGMPDMIAVRQLIGFSACVGTTAASELSQLSRGEVNLNESKDA